MKNFFEYRREAGQNPWCGIMSFQHFSGEEMYSDIVVKPENNMTETERVECYPISPDAEENGRNEGYYPESSVVYIRSLWREFEPKRGEYNYGFIEELLNKAKKHGQSMIFRLMGHSTRWQDDVPEWLKELIDCPERPDGKRVKDSPTDPLYTELFLEAVKHLGARFDSDPALYAVDISLPGAWGEGHKLELFGEDIITRIADVYIKAFPTTLLFAQCIRPGVINYIGQTHPVGWRGDGLGEPDHTFNQYPERIEKIKDKWQTGPVAFESYWWLMEWERRGWDIDRIIECTLDWHISSFNPKSMPIPYAWREKIDAWIAKMGYHFTIKSAEIPETASERATVKIEIENVGAAPLYEKIPFVLRLTSGEKEVLKLDTGATVGAWLPGVHTVECTVPTHGLAQGKYAVEVAITADGMPEIFFATNAPKNGRFYRIGMLEKL